MDEISAPLTFRRKIDGTLTDLTVPEDFVKDFHFSSDQHLMIMIRVIGTDYKKVIEFFKDSEGEHFKIEIEPEDELPHNFILSSMYMDEGPPLNVDINSEIPMARLILDYKVEQ